MAALLSWRRDNAASLFERIQKKDENPSFNYDFQSNLKLFVNSIKSNLSNILNTHPETSQSAIELGIMDLNDATSNATDIYNKIAMIIRECIITFEPRIKDVIVKPLPNYEQPLVLFFYIQAVIRFEDDEKNIAFNLHLDNDHRYYLDMTNII